MFGREVEYTVQLVFYFWCPYCSATKKQNKKTKKKKPTQILSQEEIRNYYIAAVYLINMIFHLDQNLIGPI